MRITPQYMKPLSLDQVITLCESEQFPTIVEYLDTHGVYGDTYHQPCYEWHGTFEPRGSTKWPSSIVCIRQESYGPHLSILEVPVMNRGNGLGTRAVEAVELMRPDAKAVSLYARTPQLIAFYAKLGYDLINQQRLMMKGPL